MRYLLIEKTDDNQFEAELIERGYRHKKTAPLARNKMSVLMEDTLARRFNFSHWQQQDVFMNFYKSEGLIDLGIQKGINNCIVTNLFAAIEVIRHRNGKDDFNSFCYDIKARAIRRYYMYAFDFYPFGNTSEVMREINSIFPQTI